MIPEIFTLFDYKKPKRYKEYFLNTFVRTEKQGLYLLTHKTKNGQVPEDHQEKIQLHPTEHDSAQASRFPSENTRTTAIY